MRLNKLSNFVGFKFAQLERYLKDADTDLRNLFLWSQGRVRFGSEVDDTFGENIAGEFHTLTTPTTTETNHDTEEVSVTHSLGTETNIYLTISQEGKGTIYTSSGVNSTTTYFRSDQTGTNFTIFLLK